MTQKLAGVLLDIDGTLVDSNDGNARAWFEALLAQGIEVSYVKIREAVGMGGDNLLPTVAKVKKDSPEGEAASKACAEIFKSKYQSGVKAFPQVKELLTRLHGMGLKLVVATSGKKEQAHAMLELTGALGLIDVMATAEDAESSKPAPDIIQAALKKSGLAPGEVIMLGDTPYDVQAARKAGVGIVGLRCGGWGAPDLKGALAVYDGPANLLAHLEASPLSA